MGSLTFDLIYCMNFGWIVFHLWLSTAALNMTVLGTGKRLMVSRKNSMLELAFYLKKQKNIWFHVNN